VRCNSWLFFNRVLSGRSRHGLTILRAFTTLAILVVLYSIVNVLWSRNADGSAGHEQDVPLVPVSDTKVVLTESPMLSPGDEDDQQTGFAHTEPAKPLQLRTYAVGVSLLSSFENQLRLP